MMQAKAAARWDKVAESYALRTRLELSDSLAQAWCGKILQYAPNKMPLRVLDVGTGGGFLAILLAQEGHTVTGIDSSEGMVRRAKRNAQAEFVEPDFLVMDAHNLTFKEKTFDLIVSRNVTWMLDDPEKVYAEWKRVLKPGGKVVIFDADYSRAAVLPQMKKVISSNPELCLLYGELPWKTPLPQEKYCASTALNGVSRPQWDVDVLSRLGFMNVTVDKSVEGLSCFWDEKALHRHIPLFLVAASKAKDRKMEEEMIVRYWQQRAPEYGGMCLKDMHTFKRRAWGELIERYAPAKRPLRILEVGTGTGFLSIVMALRGHEVTGVDVSNARIAEAIANAKQMKAQVNFICTEADDLPFPSEQFDLVVCRNLIWNLPNPELAFSQWYRVLVQNGRLIYFDGNWHMQPADEEDGEYFDFFRKQTREKDHFSFFNDEAVDPELFGRTEVLARKKRPEWDRRTLPKWGLIPLAIKCDVSEQVWDEAEKSRYFMTPLFMVVAEKMKKTRDI